ncbi:MAG TPA: NeuD/PglB/VioB family sugar acetyltransferase [Chryseolinea sp.]|nr:NeuD/PglB/VioB family sugar acetyltransferase [Chryseolinea sp.]HPM31545.1 NeuD/PglB/VioB family sugar acetyltransferase [Chryseolinea sp.]
MTCDIAIFGAGGFGRETALMIRQINEVQPNWNLIGFYDDALPKGNVVDGIKILGGLAELNKVREKLSLAIAVADPATRKRIVSNISNENIDFPVLKHPHNFLGDDQSNQFGRGCIITAGNIFTLNVNLQEFVIVNLACTIGHDATIGSFSTIMPGCSISGNVKIGTSTLIGSGVRVLQNISMGDNCKVGAGAVVIQDSRGDVTLLGVPAREKV